MRRWACSSKRGSNGPRADAFENGLLISKGTGELGTSVQSHQSTTVLKAAAVDLESLKEKKNSNTQHGRRRKTSDESRKRTVRQRPLQPRSSRISLHLARTSVSSADLYNSVRLSTPSRPLAQNRPHDVRLPHLDNRAKG
eukprot:2045767-Pleurochrysis_carterae.AAC.3